MMLSRKWKSFGIVAAVMLTLAVVGAVLSRSRGQSASFVISRGGTYTGNWSSDDPNVAVVSINTSEPVIIENATLRGPGHLIVSSARHADITIRNARGQGVNPNVVGKSVGRFASIERFNHVTIENCDLEGTAGIYLLDYAGDRTPAQSVKIIGNRSKNIDGRRSDGKGGYTRQADLVQFAQFDKVRHVPGIEIAWNEVINEPGKSSVEDNISIYLSSGTHDSPIRIHNNFIRGGYPIDPLKDEYSGGGIMLGDGVGETTDDDPSFVEAYDNQVLDTVNYGIAISAGHDNTFYNNRIVSAGVIDGKPIAAQNVGAYIWDSYKAGKDHFFNNTGRDNVIGWVNKDGRNDSWTPHATTWENVTHLPSPLTPKAYDDEWQRWQAKLKSANRTVGPATRASGA